MTLRKAGWVVLGAVLLAAGNCPAGGKEFYHDVNLRLSGGLFCGDDPADKADIELYLGVSDPLLPPRNDAWNPHLMGWAGREMTGWIERRERAYNQMDHTGVLKGVERAGHRLRLRVDVTVNPDPWVPGGAAAYVIDLESRPPGSADRAADLAGTFSGTFKGKPVQGTVTGTVRKTLWPSPDETYSPHEPGEHPRLILRKQDLPALKARASTPEGKAILARLDAVLAKPWTLWHPMGYAVKYRLTGDSRWAERAREETDAARGGKQQSDRRYSYTSPGGKLRAGSSFAAIAMAYDLCYDAWDPAYRRALAGEIQDKVWGGLAYKTGGGQHSPRSNHYGAWQGGAGTAILAVTGDPGTDPEITDAANRLYRQRAKRAFYDGYGSKAYFFEGHHCGRLSTNTGLSSYLQALRVAAGEDWITNYPPARWLLTKWVYELVRSGGQLRNLQRGMYARGFGRGGMSSGGDFAQGFGICPEAHKPAVLWTYNHVVEPGPGSTYDALNYPHRAVYAFVNWPVGMTERNPAEIFPKVLHDERAEYYVFRSGWEGEGDIIVTAVGGEKRPFRKPDVLVLGRGKRAAFPVDWPHLRDADLAAGGDGAYVLSRGGTSLAVDFTQKSGAPLLIAAAGPGAGGAVRKGAEIVTLTPGGHRITVMTLGKTVKVEVKGDAVVAGDRTIRFDGTRLVLGG